MLCFLAQRTSSISLPLKIILLCVQLGRGYMRSVAIGSFPTQYTPTAKAGASYSTGYYSLRYQACVLIAWSRGLRVRGCKLFSVDLRPYVSLLLLTLHHQIAERLYSSLLEGKMLRILQMGLQQGRFIQKRLLQRGVLLPTMAVGLFWITSYAFCLMWELFWSIISIIAIIWL